MNATRLNCVRHVYVLSSIFLSLVGFYYAVSSCKHWSKYPLLFKNKPILLHTLETNLCAKKNNTWVELTHVFIFYSLHNVYRWSKKSGDGERTYLNGDETRAVWITKMPFNGFYDFNAINYNPMNINAHSKSILIWKLAIDFSRSLSLLSSFSPFSLPLTLFSFSLFSSSLFTLSLLFSFSLSLSSTSPSLSPSSVNSFRWEFFPSKE